MHALKYFIAEAAASLWRGRRAALLAILTITAAVFVLGFFLVLTVNLQRLVDRWTESAELSIFLADDVTDEQLEAVGELVDRSGLAARRTYVSREQALARFAEDFPDLAGTAERLDGSPFPASMEIRLDPAAHEAEAAVGALASTLASMTGVADVRYDRRWLSRLNLAIRAARALAALVVGILAVASALTVAGVVRLAAIARRDEIEIMQLVGAPAAYIRGPFVAEGFLQGGAGAVAALALLWGAFAGAKLRFGELGIDVLGVGRLTFLSLELSLAIVAGGMLLGSIAGFAVARTVK